VKTIRWVIYLTPCIPLSIIWRCILSMRGKRLKRGAVAPLKLPLILNPEWRVKERRSLSYIAHSPSLIKREG